MKKLLIVAAVAALSVNVMAGDYTRIFTKADQPTYVDSVQEVKSLQSKVKPKANEVRKPYGFRVTELVETEIDTITNGMQTITVSVPVEWKYVKVEGQDLSPMTTEEKNSRDAYDATKEAEAEQATQDAKSQLQKNREKKFKDIGLDLGLTFPVQKGALDVLINDTIAAVEVDLGNNKKDDAIRKMYKAVTLDALRYELGDAIYDPLIGEGGQ